MLDFTHSRGRSRTVATTRDGGGLVMHCRIGNRVVWVPSLGMLPGTEIRRQGDRGRLVLAHDVAVDHGLA